MITRKQFLATGSAGLASAMGAAPQQARPRNVLFLLSDQHHPRAMSWTGQPDARTPNLDALATLIVLANILLVAGSELVRRRAKGAVG